MSDTTNINTMIASLTEHQRHEFALVCARRVQHLMPDQSSVATLYTREKYLRGEATNKEMTEAWAAARAAARDAENTEWAAEQAASKAAALATSGDAAGTAQAVAEALAWAGSGSVERLSERAWQRTELERMLEEVKDVNQ